MRDATARNDRSVAMPAVDTQAAAVPDPYLAGFDVETERVLTSHASEAQVQQQIEVDPEHGTGSDATWPCDPSSASPASLKEAAAALMDETHIEAERTELDAKVTGAALTKSAAAALQTVSVCIAVCLQVRAAGAEDGPVSLRYEVCADGRRVPHHNRRADAAAKVSLQRDDASGPGASPAPRPPFAAPASFAADVASAGKALSGDAAAPDASEKVEQEGSPTPCSLTASPCAQYNPSAALPYPGSPTRQRHKKNVPVVLRALIPPHVALPAPLLAPVASRPIKVVMWPAPPWTKFSGPPPRPRESPQLRPLHPSPHRRLGGPPKAAAISETARPTIKAQQDATQAALAAAAASLAKPSSFHAQPAERQALGLRENSEASSLAMPDQLSPMDVRPPVGKSLPVRLFHARDIRHAAKFDEVAYVRELVLGPRNRAAVF